MTDELRYLKSKVTKWCDAVRTGKLHKDEAWYVFESTIMKTIEYPLRATTFTKQQLDELMSPLLTTILPLAGVQRRIPRKLVYGTLRSKGLNIKDPYVTQTISHLQTILSHHHRNTPTRDLLDDNIDIVQTHVGSEHPFWELPFTTYGKLAPNGWIKQTWEALDNTPLTLKGVDITQKPLRDNDKYLMDIFVNSQKYTDDEIAILQDCRLSVEVTLLSQCCTADGKEIDDDIWNGRKSNQRLKQPWVNTYRPGMNKWTLWRQALRDNFLFTHAAHKRLRQPLGSWKTEMDTEWRWWKDVPNDALFERTKDNHWRRWDKNPTQRGATTKYQQPYDMAPAFQPHDVIRTQVTHQNGSNTATAKHSGTHTPQEQHPNPTTLKDQVSLLPSTAHWALTNVNHNNNGASIARDIL
ncbi:MAG: hypothetical protein LC687_07460, partial [Actinobacteria bacterium]|nr:hypothetical protein [Actinomycetota bacterium]